MTEEKKPESSGSAPEDAGNPDSQSDDHKNPADAENSQGSKDVEGSSTEKDQEEKPSLLNEIEDAIEQETGKTLEDKAPSPAKKEEPDDKGSEEGKKPDEGKKPEESKKPAEGEKPEAGKKPDADQDEGKKLLEVPEGVKEGTKAHERFQELVATNKKLTSEKDGFEQQVSDMRESVAETGIDKGEFSSLMDYAYERKKGDPKRALEFLDRERKALILQIGEHIEPPNVLDDFPDLKKKVTDGDLSAEDAVKQAKLSNLESEQAKADEKAKADKQAQDDVDKQVVENRDKVIAMEKKWMEDDLDWGAKRDLLQPKLVEINKLPPAQWPKAVQDAYDLITATIKASIPTVKKLDPNSPVGSGGSDEKGVEEPKTLFDALKQANQWD